MDSLGTALPAEMKRIREVVLPAYQSLGLVGQFGLVMINADLTRAEEALASGDVAAMIKSYASLREIEL